MKNEKEAKFDASMHITDKTIRYLNLWHLLLIIPNSHYVIEENESE